MQNLHEQLKSLEERYWDAVQHKDVDEAMELSDEPCIIVGAQGVGVIDRERMGKMLNEASYQLESYTFDEKTIRIRKLTDDVEIIAYQVVEELVVEDRPVKLVAHDASVWIAARSTRRASRVTRSVARRRRAQRVTRPAPIRMCSDLLAKCAGLRLAASS